MPSRARVRGQLRRRIGKRVSEVRGERSQRQFAKEIGTSQQNVNRIERGLFLPSFDSMAILAKAESINLNWLVLGEGPMKRRTPKPNKSAEKKKEEGDGAAEAEAGN